MAEVTIKIPEAIKDIIEGMNDTIYVETLIEVAAKRIPDSQRKLKELRKEIDVYEAKYSTSYEEFSKNFADTMEGHNDWIEWSYFIKVSEELSRNIEKLKMLSGK